MADPKQQISVPLPPGMSQEEFLKLFGTFQKQRVEGKRKDTAFRATLSRIKTAHEAEWDRIFQEELAKASGE